MTRERAQLWIFGAWLAAVGLTTVRQIAGKSSTNLAGYMPDPSVYLGSAVLFTMLWGGSFIAPSLAAVLAVGTDIGLIVSPYLKGSNVGILDTANTWLEKVSPPAASTPSTGGNS